MLDQGHSCKRPRFDFTNQSLECQLRFAAKYSSLETINRLVTHKNADINSQNYNGHTPLLISILEGRDRRCVELLCELGADVNYMTDKLYGYCPLHFAAESDKADIIEVLVNYKALRNCQTFTGCTPLHLAAMNGNLEAVRILCLTGANVNIPEWYNGYTPLHYAIIRGHSDIVYLLLEFNASFVSTTFNGHTALTLCDKDLRKHFCHLKKEPKVLEKICLDVIRKLFLWPNSHRNIVELPLPKSIIKKILLKEYSMLDNKEALIG